MLDDVEDLVDREVQGVKAVESSVFTVVGERPPWELGPDAPLHASLSCWLEGSRILM